MLFNKIGEVKFLSKTLKGRGKKKKKKKKSCQRLIKTHQFIARIGTPAKQVELTQFRYFFSINSKEKKKKKKKKKKEKKRKEKKGKRERERKKGKSITLVTSYNGHTIKAFHLHYNERYLPKMLSHTLRAPEVKWLHPWTVKTEQW